MGVSAEARFGDCPRVFMRLDAVCEEPSHWETGPNETVSAGIKGGNRRASSVWNTSAFRLPYALLVALNDPSKSPSTPATCAKSPARPCVFVLTKGMSAVGPRPTADIPLPMFARHPHRRSARLGVSGRARMSLVSVQSSNLPERPVVEERRHFWAWCPSAYRRDSASVGLNAQRLVFAACSLPSGIGGNRS